MKAQVNLNREVFIDAEACSKVGLSPGDEVEIEIRQQRIVIRQKHLPPAYEATQIPVTASVGELRQQLDHLLDKLCPIDGGRYEIRFLEELIKICRSLNIDL